jgi:hypothetical protein
MSNSKFSKEVNSNETEKSANVILYYKKTNAVVITSGETWYIRLWYLISNPFRYLFTGLIKY